MGKIINTDNFELVADDIRKLIVKHKLTDGDIKLVLEYLLKEITVIMEQQMKEGIYFDIRQIENKNVLKSYTG